jgi:hypothetical protein
MRIKNACFSCALFAGSSLHRIFRILRYVRSYSYLFDNGFVLGLFTSAAVALFSHKILVIILHRPWSTWGLVFAGPFLFVFDVITLILLYYALASMRIAWRITGSIVAVLIVSLSAMFASLYFEANAEINWGRSVAVSIQIFDKV